jgi:hypothetical protein
VQREERAAERGREAAAEHLVAHVRHERAGGGVQYVVGQVQAPRVEAAGELHVQPERERRERAPALVRVDLREVLAPEVVREDVLQAGLQRVHDGIVADGEVVVERQVVGHAVGVRRHGERGHAEQQPHVRRRAGGAEHAGGHAYCVEHARRHQQDRLRLSGGGGNGGGGGSGVGGGGGGSGCFRYQQGQILGKHSGLPVRCFSCGGNHYESDCPTPPPGAVWQPFGEGRRGGRWVPAGGAPGTHPPSSAAPAAAAAGAAAAVPPSAVAAAAAAAALALPLRWRSAACASNSSSAIQLLADHQAPTNDEVKTRRI